MITRLLHKEYFPCGKIEEQAKLLRDGALYHAFGYGFKTQNEMKQYLKMKAFW